VDQLQRLLPFLHDDVQIVAHVYHPQVKPEEWSDTSIIAPLRHTPEILINLDEDGRITQQFGVYASGHTLLYYLPDRRLCFTGGITNGRGHAGDSIGGAAIRSLVEHSHLTSHVTLPVYGCSVIGGIRK
jgi:hypothetical protein